MRKNHPLKIKNLEKKFQWSLRPPLTSHLSPLTYRSSSIIHHPSPIWGFSLIELVISLAILSIGVVASVRVFPLGLRASRRAEMRSRAAMLIQRHLESLKLVPWETLQDGETKATEEEFQVTTRIFIPSVEGLVDETRLKALKVSVEWMQNERSQHIHCMTYVRRPQDEE